jgi:hypothetical protein
MTLGSLTKARGRVRAWKAVGAFCAGRGGDYAELISLELADTKATLLREVIAMVALAIGLLFALSFLCIALIATSFGTPHFDPNCVKTHRSLRRRCERPVTTPRRKRGRTAHSRARSHGHIQIDTEG